MNRVALDRRRFLRLVGATALTAPFLRALPSYAAGGASGTSGDPVYLVLLFTSCGVVRFKWGAQGPAPTGTTPTVTTPLVFRDTLSALTKAGPMGVDLTSKVSVLDGLHVTGAGTASHEAGMAALWTGSKTDNTANNVATGPSIDQAIAPLLASQLGIRSTYPTVALMAQSSADYTQRQVSTRMLYDASANWVDPYTDPAMAQSALFPGAVAATPGGDKTGLIRKQVAAQLNGDFGTLQAKLCTEDRQQLQNLQAVWNQTQEQIQSAAMAAAACSVPSLGAAPPAGTDPFPTYVQSMSNILAMALACDLTRVGSLQLSHALSPVTHTWLGASQTDTHHNFSHKGPSYIGALGPDFYNEPASVTSTYPQQLIDIDAWYAKQVAAFAYTLSQFKTASGRNLLDQTVICWGSELDMGAYHDHINTPFVLIGGGGGKLLTNRVVRFPLKLDAIPSTSNIVDRSQNDLLLTLAKVMGVDAGTTFGNPSYCTGPITQVLA